MAFIDITRALNCDTPIFPGDPLFKSERIASFERGDAFEQWRLELTDHTGTHLDAPAHVIPGGMTVDQIPVDRLFGVIAHVVEVPEDATAVEEKHLASLEVEPEDAVLLKGCHSLARARCHVTLEAAERLVGLQAGVVGIDFLSPDSVDSKALSVHRLLLSRNILLIENLDLSGVECGTYFLFCLPLRIEGASGSPCRVLLMPGIETEEIACH